MDTQNQVSVLPNEASRCDCTHYTHTVSNYKYQISDKWNVKPFERYHLNTQLCCLTCTEHKKSKTEHRHTHTRLTALFPELPRWAGTRKVKPIWILLKQETVSGSGISGAICKCAPCSRQVTMPAPHRSVFFTRRMPFLPPNQQRENTEGKTEHKNTVKYIKVICTQF